MKCLLTRFSETNTHFWLSFTWNSMLSRQFGKFLYFATPYYYPEMMITKCDLICNMLSLWEANYSFLRHNVKSLGKIFNSMDLKLSHLCFPDRPEQKLLFCSPHTLWVDCEAIETVRKTSWTWPDVHECFSDRMFQMSYWIFKVHSPIQKDMDHRFRDRFVTQLQRVNRTCWHSFYKLSSPRASFYYFKLLSALILPQEENAFHPTNC